MSNETDKETRRLDARMQSAVVDLVDEDSKTYEVFVPGAVREVTTVVADSEDEAKEKTRTLLLSKMQHIASKKVERTGESDGELEVQNGAHGAEADSVEEGQNG